MTRTIWKFPLHVDDVIRIDMPYGAVVRTVQQQGDRACLWAEVVAEAEREPRYFRVFGTGHVMPNDVDYGYEYVGTWQAGQFVWHLYEVTGR